MPNTFKPVVTANVGTSLTPVYTVPAATQSTAIGWTIANTSASPITVTATLTAGGVTGRVIANAPVPVGSTLVVVGGEQKIAMATGNVLSVQSSAAASCDSIVSVLELS
jgi:hypothetical protein